jgi:glycosyltransferase involved in cell wall biosynthesis
MDVSVVVPTYRRDALLQRCLDAILAQRFDPARVEIVVVDDGRSAGTRALVESLAARRAVPSIRYVQPPRGARGPAAARNAGWRAATAPIVAFTDDDTVPAQDWLAAGLHAVAPADIAAAWGRVKVPLPAQPSDWERNVARLDGAEFLTANVFVRRALLAAVGGFDERFKRAWREDSDLQFTLLERGGRIVHAADAVVLHPVRAARWGVSLGLQKNMLFDALLYKKHPRLYRTRISPGPPLRYYLIVALLVTTLAGALAGSTPVAGASAISWLLLTLAFAMQRLRGTRTTPAHVAEMLVTSAAIPPLAVFWRLAGAVRFRVLFA